jgi:hypothetical protein
MDPPPTDTGWSPPNIDTYIHEYTRLPCTSFLRECTDTAIQGRWRIIVQEGLVDNQSHPHRDRLLRQLEHAQTDRLPIDGVQPICDPERTAYMYEIYEGTQSRREHLEKLLRLEPIGNARRQLMLLQSAILESFPTGGMQTSSAVELTDLFLAILTQSIRL